MNANAPKSVAVITPTIGSKSLYDAAWSVFMQDYKGPINHVIVLDGEQHAIEFDDVDELINQSFVIENPSTYRRTVIRLPWNTGKANGQKFWGHRVFASLSALVNEDIVFFLDDDNMYRPNHVSSLVDLITTNNLHWAHSLRNIETGDEYFPDNCESLGAHPVWTSYINRNAPHHHIDTSAYAFVRDFIGRVGSVWYGGYAQDRVVCETLLRMGEQHPFGCTGLYTLDYSLGSTEDSASPDFFRQGNEFMAKKYPERFPWSKE